MFHHGSGSVLSPSLLLLHLSRSVCCCFLLFVSFLLICVNLCHVFVFYLGHLLHFWRMSCWLFYGLLSLLSPCMSSCFWIVLPCVRIWATLYFLLCDISLLNACTMDLAWLFLMLFWFTCMFGYDLGNFVLWAYSQMSLSWTVFVDTLFWACILFHCSTAHYKPLA